MSSRTIQMDDRTYAYLLEYGVTELPLLRRLREETARRQDARMQISPEQGQLLDWLVRALGVRRAIEVGTFTGYSSLRMLLAMPPDGRMMCCDIDPEVTSVARRYWAEAGVADRVDLRIGPAADTLTPVAQQQPGSFDLVFIDADKESYGAYVELAWALLRPGGVAALDNVLWSGRVSDPADTAESTRALREVNASLHHDSRWFRAMIPIGDGLTLLHKR